MANKSFQEGRFWWFVDIERSSRFTDSLDMQIYFILISASASLLCWRNDLWSIKNSPFDFFETTKKLSRTPWADLLFVAAILKPCAFQSCEMSRANVMQQLTRGGPGNYFDIVGDAIKLWNLLLCLTKPSFIRTQKYYFTWKKDCNSEMQFLVN